MILEIFLGLSMATVLINGIRFKKIGSVLKDLKIQNAALAEGYFDVESEEYIEHDWKEGEEVTVYTSHAPWSYEHIICSTSFCTRCNLVHRNVKKGLILAEKKGLSNFEGFFYSGAKVADYGCRVREIKLLPSGIPKPRLPEGRVIKEGAE